MSDELNNGTDLLSEMRFPSLKRKEVKVVLEDKNYVLVEATKGQVSEWDNAKLKATQLKDGKIAGLNGMPDTEAYFVSLCLKEDPDPDDPSKRKPVPLVTVKGMPDPVVTALFDRAKKLCGKEEKESLERKAFLKALERKDAPLSLEQAREWFERLKDEDSSYSCLYDLVSPSQEEQAKN